MTNPAATALRAAKALIGTPSKWTQGAPAKAADGTLLLARDQGAICWDIIGAIVAAAGDDRRASTEALAILERVLGTELIADWNDAPERTHHEVMEMLDRAIASAEGV